MSEQKQIRKKSSSTPSPAFTPRSGLIQRKCACGGSAGVDGECAECRSKRLSVQRSPASQAETTAVPPVVHEVLSSPGQPLDAETRAYMEPRFGHDFSKVRVHTDSKAAESAQAINALAYTAGRDIAFGAGQYAPQTTEGRKLLAHELTHVAQQENAAIPANSDSITPANHPSEQEADAAGRNISAPGSLATPAGVALKREPPATSITFGEKEGSTIDHSRISAEEYDRGAMILANLKSAENQGRINIQQYYTTMLQAVDDFKESAGHQIDALDVEPKSFEEVVPGLFRTIVSVVAKHIPGLAILEDIMDKFEKAYNTLGKLEAANLGGDPKKVAKATMENFAKSVRNSQVALLNDLSANLRSNLLTLSVTNPEVENDLYSVNLDPVLEIAGVPDPNKFSPYGPIREALEVQFSEYIARLPFEAAKGSFLRRLLPGTAPTDEDVHERIAVGNARVEARKRSRAAAQAQHQPGSEEE